MKPNHHLWQTLPLLVLPPLFWAGNFVVGRALRADIPPFSLSFGRWLIAFVVLLPFAWRFVKQDWQLYPQYWRQILATAVLGVTLFNTLIYQGLHYTITTNALLLNSCIPVLIMLFGAVFYRQKLIILQILGLALSLFGVLVIILNGQWQNFVNLTFNKGDILVFLAMICWAFYTLLMKNLPTHINRIGLMSVQIAITLILLLPFCLWEMLSGKALILQPSSLLGLAYIGVLPSVVAYLLYTLAVTKLGAVRAGLSIHLMPVFGVILSIVFLGEQLQFYHVVGIFLIVIGLVLSNKKATTT